MGKRLIIKDADFSANAIPSNESAVLSALSVNFYAQYGLLENGGKVSDNTRCCITAADISELLSEGSKLTIKVKDSFDFVFGVGNGNTITYYQAGDSVIGTFMWITTQLCKAPISNLQKYIYLNFRYKNNTTVFTSTTLLSDLLDIAIVE